MKNVKDTVNGIVAEIDKRVKKIEKEGGMCSFDYDLSKYSDEMKEKVFDKLTKKYSVDWMDEDVLNITS